MYDHYLRVLGKRVVPTLWGSMTSSKLCLRYSTCQALHKFGSKRKAFFNSIKALWFSIRQTDSYQRASPRTPECTLSLGVPNIIIKRVFYASIFRWYRPRWSLIILMLSLKLFSKRTFLLRWPLEYRIFCNVICCCCGGLSYHSILHDMNRPIPLSTLLLVIRLLHGGVHLTYSGTTPSGCCCTALTMLAPPSWRRHTYLLLCLLVWPFYVDMYDPCTYPLFIHLTSGMIIDTWIEDEHLTPNTICSPSIGATGSPVIRALSENYLTLGVQHARII